MASIGGDAPIGMSQEEFEALQRRLESSNPAVSVRAAVRTLFAQTGRWGSSASQKLRPWPCTTTSSGVRSVSGAVGQGRAFAWASTSDS